HVAASDDGQSILGAKAKPHVFTPEHDAAQAAVFVLEREVHVARRVMLEIADLAVHRHARQARIAGEALFYDGRKLPDGINLWFRLLHLLGEQTERSPRQPSLGPWAPRAARR